MSPLGNQVLISSKALLNRTSITDRVAPMKVPIFSYIFPQKTSADDCLHRLCPGIPETPESLQISGSTVHPYDNPSCFPPSPHGSGTPMKPRLPGSPRAPLQDRGEKKNQGVIADAKAVYVWQDKFAYLHCQILRDMVPVIQGQERENPANNLLLELWCTLVPSRQ